MAAFRTPQASRSSGFERAVVTLGLRPLQFHLDHFSLRLSRSQRGAWLVARLLFTEFDDERRPRIVLRRDLLRPEYPE